VRTVARLQWSQCFFTTFYCQKRYTESAHFRYWWSDSFLPCSPFSASAFHPSRLLPLSLRFPSLPFSRPPINYRCLGETYLVCIEGRKRRVIKIAIGGMYASPAPRRSVPGQSHIAVMTSVSIRWPLALWLPVCARWTVNRGTVPRLAQKCNPSIYFMFPDDTNNCNSTYSVLFRGDSKWQML